MAGQLRSLGAVVEVSKINIKHKKEGFEVTLISVGSSTLQIVKKIREITGLGLKDSKILVDNFGVVGIYKSSREANAVKEILESVGAKVRITKFGNTNSDEEPAEPKKPKEDGFFIVLGQIPLSNQRPAEAFIVRVFDRDMRSEQLLGETRTDRKGFYKILYTSGQFRYPQKIAADLVVRVYNNAGEEVDKTDVYFNAPNVAQIDFQLSIKARIQSDHESLIIAISPLIGEIMHSELSLEDIWYLANKTENPIDNVSMLAQASGFERLTNLPASIFFAFGLAGLGVASSKKFEIQSETIMFPVLDIKTLFKEPLEELFTVLKSSVEENIIPAEFLVRIDDLEALHNKMASS